MFWSLSILILLNVNDLILSKQPVSHSVKSNPPGPNNWPMLVKENLIDHWHIPHTFPRMSVLWYSWTVFFQSPKWNPSWKFIKSLELIELDVKTYVFSQLKILWPVAIARGFLDVLLLVIQGLDGAGQNVSGGKASIKFLSHITWLSYRESWMWASSSFELVRLSPRAPWGMWEEYRACYKDVTCHEYCHEVCHLLCGNPGISMTSHVQGRCLLENCISILFAETKVGTFFNEKERVGLLTLHIKNKLWLDKTWDFQESPCRTFDQAQTPQLSRPLLFLSAVFCDFFKNIP